MLSSIESEPRTPTLRRALPLLTAAGEPSTPALIRVCAPVVPTSNCSHKPFSSTLHEQQEPNLSASSSSLLHRALNGVKKSGKALRRSISSSKAGRNFIGHNSKSRHIRSMSEKRGRIRRDESELLRLRKERSYHLRLQSSAIDKASPPSGSHDLSQSMAAAPRGNGESVVGASKLDVKVPLLLQEGVPLYKVSAKKKKLVTFRIDADEGCLLWESKKSGIAPIECIKEIRSGVDTRYYREQFQLSFEYEPRWMTIIYIIDGKYKTLHVIAPTLDVFGLLERTLRALYAVRQALMSGLGYGETRERIWEKRYWRVSDEKRDERLSFEEVEKMCRRLNLTLPRSELLSRFMDADKGAYGYLDFDGFKQFVKLLKARPEVDRLYRKLVGNGILDFVVFERFMRNSQKSNLQTEELEVIFKRYASPPSNGRRCLDKETAPLPVAASESSTAATTGDHTTPEENEINELAMTLDAFTSFLSSPENSAFSEQEGRIWQDMTHPLSDYFVSSSHNTYLVGHQLVGTSTIEGYIRALLHSCRSVEIDIYDGEVEPVIYHGKTLTTKVPLRDICEAIAKYAFVASPYPIIISAEVHCSLTQQDKVARIMHEIFGDSLISAPLNGRPPLTRLPSPEDLRGCILLKAKNLYLSAQGSVEEKMVTVDVESSSSTSTSETTESESEFVQEVKVGLKHELSKARNMDAVKEIREELQRVKKMDPMKELKEEYGKARSLYDRVRRRKSLSPAPSKPLSPPTNASSRKGSFPTGSRPPINEKSKVKMSFELLALLVYTVGVKCRGFNKKETYAPEHLFSLSERMANKIMKQGMIDLIKHNRTHLVRIYPNGTRLASSNYEPHKYWAAGAQLVAINWQTFDLGYMINHSMFQRNGRAGYVLKSAALREPKKELLSTLTKHVLEITIISAQQLPRREDKASKGRSYSNGLEIADDGIIDPYVEVSIHVPDWTLPPVPPKTVPSSSFSKLDEAFDNTVSAASSSSMSLSRPTATVCTARTSVIKNNGFNPVWEEPLSIPFSVYGHMLELVFLRIVVRHGKDDEKDEPIAVYCCPLGTLGRGYRHLALHDAQLSQYLFSTLFVHVDIRDV